MSRVPTGIAGLDELIRGGFPANTVNLVSGPAGSAKTLLGMQYIYNGAKYYNQPGIYLTLEESKESIQRAMRNFGMDIERYEREEKIYILDLGKLRTECDTAEELDWGLVGFSTLQDFLTNHFKFSNAKRLSIDSITAVGLYYSNIETLRREMFRFARFLKETDVTSLLITETTGEKPTRYGIEEFISDSFVLLGYESIAGEYRRTIMVRKMRYTKHDPVKHPFLILSSGIEVSPDEIL